MCVCLFKKIKFVQIMYSYLYFNKTNFYKLHAICYLNI